MHAMYDRCMSDRFWTKVNKTDTCWLWTAGKWQGYGRYRAGTRNVLAHKHAYELANGPIPAGLELDHLCRVRECVRPDHLEAVTHAENVRRGNGGMPARLTCRQGHRYEGDNIYYRPDGRGRDCYTCIRSRRRS